MGAPTNDPTAPDRVNPRGKSCDAIGFPKSISCSKCNDWREIKAANPKAVRGKGRDRGCDIPHDDKHVQGPRKKKKKHFLKLHASQNKWLNEKYLACATCSDSDDDSLARPAKRVCTGTDDPAEDTASEGTASENARPVSTPPSPPTPDIDEEAVQKLLHKTLGCMQELHEKGVVPSPLGLDAEVPGSADGDDGAVDEAAAEIEIETEATATEEASPKKERYPARPVPLKNGRVVPEVPSSHGVHHLGEFGKYKNSHAKLEALQAALFSLFRCEMTPLARAFLSTGIVNCPNLSISALEQLIPCIIAMVLANSGAYNMYDKELLETVAKACPSRQYLTGVLDDFVHFSFALRDACTNQRFKHQPVNIYCQIGQ